MNLNLNFKLNIKALTIVFFTCTIFLFKDIYASNVSTDWETWQLSIEQQMLNSYRLHAAEKNANNLQSTKVHDVTEVLDEYQSSGYGPDISHVWVGVRDKFEMNWKAYNNTYKTSTGYTGDDANGIPHYNLPSYATEPNDGNKISSALYNWNTWDKTNPTYQKMIKIVDDFIKNKVIPATNTFYTGKVSATNVSNYKCYTNTKQLVDWKNGVKHNIIVPSIGNNEVPIYHTYLMSADWLSINSSNVKVYVHPSSNEYMQSTLDTSGNLKVNLISDNSSIGLSWEQAKQSSSIEFTIFGQVMKNVLAYGYTGTSDTVYLELRKELTTLLANDFYRDFGNAFWTGTSTNGNRMFAGVCGITDYTIKQLDVIFDKQAYVQYCNFIYSGKKNGCWFVNRSGYYFPFSSNDTNQMGLNFSDRFKYIKYTDKEIEKFMDTYFEMPISFELNFNSNKPEYLSWLTSSIIVKNDLNKYQYWLENLSNEYDLDYYGKPKEISLSDVKDANLTGNELSLVADKHWGTLLFTRYKYVDYTYYIYYAMNDANESSSLDIVISEKNTTNSRAWKNSSNISRGNVVGSIGRAGSVNGLDQTFMWVHAWTNMNSGSPSGFGQYWVKDEDIIKAVSVVQEHIAAEKPQTEGGGTVGIIWGGQKPEYQDSWWTHGNSLRVVNGIAGYGDFYRYDQPVRAEVTYYQVFCPNTIDKTPYEICLGDDADCKDDNGCFENDVLCACEDEMGGPGNCEKTNEDFVISSTLTE